jgi:hypothetical protein
VRGPANPLRLAILGLVLVTLAGAGAGAERAAAAGIGACSDVLEQPFLPWLDPAHYVLAPDGGLEADARGWTLRGGAEVVSVNEPFFARSRADERSLALPAGSSATTPTMCVGLEHPTLRLFVANAGSPLSRLKVEVLFEGVLGLAQSVSVAHVAARTGWLPTAPLPVLVNATALPLLTDGGASVAFRFTPQGVGTWSVDDVYVDPFKGT